MFLDLSKDIDIKKADNYYMKLKEGNKKIELRNVPDNRSLKINSYLHVVITLYAIHFGYTLNEAKVLLKRNCHFMVYEKDGDKFLKETSKMDNLECSNFVDWIRNYGGVNGCYIISAEEYKQNKFAIDKEINNYKQFL